MPAAARPAARTSRRRRKPRPQLDEFELEFELEFDEPFEDEFDELLELEFEELLEDEFEELFEELFELEFEELLLLEFDELFELAFENAAPPNEKLLLVLLELLREPLDERLVEVLVEVLPRDIAPMKSIGPEATCTPAAAGPEAMGGAAARPMPTSAGAVWPIAVLACPTSGTACARAPVAVRVVSAAPAISDAVMRCVMVVSCFDATALKCRSRGERRMQPGYSRHGEKSLKALGLVPRRPCNSRQAKRRILRSAVL